MAVTSRINFCTNDNLQIWYIKFSFTDIFRVQSVMFLSFFYLKYDEKAGEREGNVEGSGGRDSNRNSSSSEDSLAVPACPSGKGGLKRRGYVG
jgi:hypothetical protein